MANLKGFYSDQSTTALTSSYQAFGWNFSALTVIVSNDDASGTNTVSISFDGSNQHMTLKPGEVVILDNTDKQGISLKFVGGAPAYRLMVEGHA